jgi:hypothetical protein
MKNTLKQRPLGLPILAMALAAMPLSAQDSGWSKLNYGLQASIAMPQGRLRYSADTGFGLAGYIEKVWSNNWALRGRLEYMDFAEGDWGLKLSQTGIMADAIYYGLHEKFYLFGGMGYFNRSENIDFYGYGDTNKTESAFSIGIGWNFTPNWGAEVKTTLAEYNWLQASVLYRF